MRPRGEFCCQLATLRIFRLRVLIREALIRIQGMEKSKETSRWKIGLFWFVATGEPSCRLASLRWPFDIEAYLSGLQSPPYDHKTAWAEVQRLDDSLAAYSFDQFPCGRLEYYPPARRWIFSVDQKLNQTSFISYMVIKWELPPGRVTIKTDPAYASLVSIREPQCPEDYEIPGPNWERTFSMIEFGG